MDGVVAALTPTMLICNSADRALSMVRPLLNYFSLLKSAWAIVNNVGRPGGRPINVLDMAQEHTKALATNDR